MSLAETLPTPEFSGASLSSSAMLVELGISVWTARKLDKRASNDVTASNHAAKGMANVNKRLLDCDELTAIQKFAGNARTSHYAMTLPWSDSGLRMLPTSKYFDYTKQMSDLQAHFGLLVQNFLDEYQWEINAVQIKLGNMFNASEYPSTEKVSSKFGFRLNYIPLPDAGDWRVDIGHQQVAELQAQYADFYNAQFERAMGDIWTRANEALTRMSERLDYGTNEDKKVFRNSLVENVVDLIDVMESMNITGDSNMQMQAKRLKTAMRDVTPEALREDAMLRISTKKAVDQVIASLPSLDF
jgi:hypothetical protein